MIDHRTLAAAILIASGSNFSYRIKEEKSPEVKPCLNCGKDKIHNNSFCSPECCKEYKKKKK